MNQGRANSKILLLTTAHCLLLAQEECAMTCQPQGFAVLLESYGNRTPRGQPGQSGQLKNQIRHTLHSLPSPTVVLQQRSSRRSVALPFLFLFFNIYLFIWFHRVLVEACSIFVALYGIFSLWPTDSLAVGPRLSCYGSWAKLLHGR